MSGTPVVLPENVENVEAMGDDLRDFIDGNTLPNVISTGSGNDLVNGFDEPAVDAAGNRLPGDTINLGDGNDEANGNGGNDTINGGKGDDTLRGLAGNDTLNGGDGDDILLGGAGSDTIDGGDGDDTIDSGNFGNNVIDGGAGTDTIDFGLGDRVTGGPGKDDFELRGWLGAEDANWTWTITDFSTREQIDVSSLGIDGAEMTAALNAAEQVGDDLRITFPNGAIPLFTIDTVLVLEGFDFNEYNLTHATSGAEAEFLTA